MIFASSQISDAAAARWRRRPALAAAVFGTAELVLAVNDKQAGRLCDLGARARYRSSRGIAEADIRRNENRPQPDGHVETGSR